MKYEDRIIQMQGIITAVYDGAISLDFKGRLGTMKIPLRMLITDYPLEVGQEVAFRMSFPEVMGPEIKEKYLYNIHKKKQGASYESF